MSALALQLPETTVPAPVESAVVSAEGLVRRYGEGALAVEALRGVSLDVDAGRMTAIMGPSGSGKSTLMHMLAGLDTPTEGSIVLDGVDITRLSEKKLTLLRRETIGFVFQFFNLLPMLTAEENVTLPLAIAGEKPDRAWVEELLDTFGIADRRARIDRPSSRAASSSASPSRERSSHGRRSCSRTSRPATSTPPPRRRFSRCFAARSTSGGRRS